MLYFVFFIFIVLAWIFVIRSFFICFFASWVMSVKEIDLCINVINPCACGFVSCLMVVYSWKFESLIVLFRWVSWISAM